MVVKGVKDGIEGLPDTVLIIFDIIDRGGALRPLLRNNIKVPDKLEGTFVVPLAYDDLVGRVLEVADELSTTSRTKVSLEDVEYKFKGSPWLLIAGGIYRNFMAISRRAFLEQ